MIVSAILAIDNKGGIGNDGKLPWGKLPSDMAWFKQHTMNHPVIMGRKTYESLGKPLPGRMNIVVSKQTFSGTFQAHTVYEALKYVRERKYPMRTFDFSEVFVIGGAQVYLTAEKYLDKLYRTKVAGEWLADTYMPLDYCKDFEQCYVKEDGNLTFEILEKQK